MAKPKTSSETAKMPTVLLVKTDLKRFESHVDKVVALQYARNPTAPKQRYIVMVERDTEEGKDALYYWLLGLTNHEGEVIYDICLLDVTDTTEESDYFGIVAATPEEELEYRKLYACHLATTKAKIIQELEEQRNKFNENEKIIAGLIEAKMSKASEA